MITSEPDQLEDFGWEGMVIMELISDSGDHKSLNSSSDRYKLQ
jgi:hypothetical protein